MTGPLDIILDKVGQEIDKEKRTCTFVPSGDEAERMNIRLQALMSSERGFVMIPVEGSSIAVTFVNKHTGFVALTEDIEEIVYQGGNNGGLINVEPLISKINALENDLNTLKKLIQSWVTVPSDGGAALKAVLSAWSNSNLSVSVRGDIENTKFKH